MESTAFESVQVERVGHVAEVTLLGPGKGNAMGPAFWAELPQVWARLDADPEVRCVLLKGSGKHFTYGLDLMAMLESLGPKLTGENLAKERLELRDVILRMQGACEGAARCRKPVVAAVQGWCLGGGVNLIAACDVRLASADARFSVREVKIGITADLGALQRLPRLIGEGNARELALTGADFDAARALRMGLVSQVFDTPEALLEGARAVARQIADNPPTVVQGIKQVMEYCADKSVEDGLRFMAVWNAAFLQSRDVLEAFAAFAEKRPPVFKGE
jgi:enoyl-CoA hydratase